MCIIIDTCELSAFAGRKDPRCEPIWVWLERGGCVVYGIHGKLGSELRDSARALQTLRQLRLAGRAHLIDDAKIAEALTTTTACCSNDAHVIALAKASGTRLVFTADALLKADFKNAKLLSKPRGKVYTTAAHKHLLQHTKGCPRYKAQPHV